MSSGSFGAACAPSTTTSAPASWAMRGDLGDRVDRAEHVRDVGDADELRPALEQLREGVAGRAGPRR